MRIQEYLILIGAFFAIPLWYDLSKGRSALKEIFRSKIKTAELFALSLMSTTINDAPKTNYEENALPIEDSHLEDKSSGDADNAIVQYQDSIVLDAEKCEGSYSKTFLVSKDTRIPISTTITIEFTYKSNTNGGYSIVSVDSAKAENNSGWTCVDSKATVDGDILYSNERREAAIPISYQASLGDGLRPQECLIRLDLSQEQ